MRIAYLFPNLNNDLEPFAKSDLRAVLSLGVEVYLLSSIPIWRGKNVKFCESNSLEVIYPRARSLIWALGTIPFATSLSLELHKKYLKRPFALVRDVLKTWVSLIFSAALLFELKTRGQIDVIHIFWGHFPSALLPMKNKYKLLPSTKVTMFLGAYDLAYGLPLSHYAAKLADVVITHSAHGRRTLQSRFQVQNVRVVYRGVEIPETGLGPIGTKTAASAGRLLSTKNFDKCIDVFALLKEHYPSAQFAIYGSGPEREALEIKARARGCYGSITFSSTLTQQQFREALKDYKFFIFASTKPGEVLPNVVKDAMLGGCIVFTTYTDGIEELVAHKRTGFVYKNFETLLENIIPDIQFAMKHSDSLRFEARQVIEKRFNNLKTMADYVGIWTEVKSDIAKK